MKLRILIASAHALFSAGVLSAAPEKPVVGILPVKNTSDNRNASMTAFESAIRNELVNSRKFEVCDSPEAAAAEQSRRKREAGDDASKIKPAYLVRMTVLQHSQLQNTYAVPEANMTGVRTEAKVVAQVEFLDAETKKVLEVKQAKAIKVSNVRSVINSTIQGNFAEKVMAEAIKDIAARCTDLLMEMVSPIKVLKIEGANVWLNAGQDRVAPGEHLNIYTLGEALIDPDTGENLGGDERFTAQIQILQVKPKFSIAAVISGSVTGDTSKMVIRKASTEQVIQAPQPVSQANPY